jgi:hypothetical protein
MKEIEQYKSTKYNLISNKTNSINEFLNVATFIFYFEHVQDYVYNLYIENDNRVSNLKIEDIDYIAMKISDKILSLSNISDFFVFKEDLNAKYNTIIVHKNSFDIIFNETLNNFQKI